MKKDNFVRGSITAKLIWLLSIHLACGDVSFTLGSLWDICCLLSATVMNSVLNRFLVVNQSL